MYKHAVLVIFTLSSAIFSPGLAKANPTSDLNPTKLFCAIREGRFFSQLTFRVDIVGDHSELVAELGNYSIQSDGSKKYISGLIFSHLAFNNNKVSGDTGDPTDIIGRMVMTRLDSGYQGRWGYVFQRSDAEVVRAIFNCSYEELRIKRYPRPPYPRGSRRQVLP